jgi:LPS O-antigen subunit length determinant protein (WzzB/FepE family)
MNLRKTDYQKRQKKKGLYGFLNLPQVHVEKVSVFWTKTPPFLPIKRDSSFPSTFQTLT